MSGLYNDAMSWQPQWHELSRNIMPKRGFFYNQMPNWGREQNYNMLVDSTATRAARILASGMVSGLTSPSRPWFKLGLPDPAMGDFEPAKEWLDQVESRMLWVLSKSNIYGTYHNMYEEIGVFGTAGAILLEDFKSVMRSRSFTCGEYFFGCGPNGRVNTFGRRYWMTISQVIEEFGLENVSPSVRSMYNSNTTDKRIQVEHLIEPNDKRIPDRADFMNMPYRSVQWERGSPSECYLRARGYMDFPVIGARWNTTTSADCYGTSPGWDSLGDIRMLHKMQKIKLLTMDKISDPPMQADASIDGEVNLLPGGVTRSSSGVPNAGVRTLYDQKPDISAVRECIGETQAAINQNFYTDLFMMLANADHDMTAREVAERHEEKLLMLGPVLERLEDEMLGPTIDRTFNIMMRSGVIPPPPPELQGMNLTVEYVSILAQAQKMVGTAGIEQFSRFVGSIGAVNPEVYDNVDFDEETNAYGKMLGIPPKILRSPEKVAAIRAQRAKAQAQAQSAQNALAAVQGANTLSKTPVGQNSALDALMGTGGGPNGQPVSGGG